MYRIYIINLILCLHTAKLNSKTISDQSKDSVSKLYDNQGENIIAVGQREFYNVNGQYEKQLSTVGLLEQSIVSADIVEHTTPYTGPSVTWDTEDKLLENTLTKQISENYESNCLLDSIKMALLWWSYPNGTLRETNLNVMSSQVQLDLSYRNISSDIDLMVSTQRFEIIEIVAFSAAYNNLTAVPELALAAMGKSLKYLTLTGNQFSEQSVEVSSQNLRCRINDDDYHIPEKDDTKLFGKRGEGIAWATFPYLPNLIELDISNCNIEFVTRAAFQNLSNLKSLYISNNKMLTIPFDTFFHIQSLQILDLSFTNVYDSFIDQLRASPTLESVLNLIYGVSIQPNTFKYLQNLIYLDLSHTKLTRASAVAFTFMSKKLNYMSLCYTSFPLFSNGIFKSIPLIGLDLSGNNYAAFNLAEDVFEGLSNSLTYLSFERSNLKDLRWLKHLPNLRFLSVAVNNINTLSADVFTPLTKLQVLDMSSNQVGNWYTQVFLNNKNLQFLSLRDNNINIITSEMLKDFSRLDYLSLGDNNFICDCMLKDLVEAATLNNQNAKCKGYLYEDMMKVINETNIINNLANVKLNEIISSVLRSEHVKKFKKRLHKLNISKKLQAKPQMRFILNVFNDTLKNSKQCLNSMPLSSNAFEDRLNGSMFKVKLLDYEEDRYWCYNETERHNLIKLECERSSLVDNITDELNSLTSYVIWIVASLFVVTLLGFVIYWKRWHIYYYYSSLKSAALLSEVSKENINKFNALVDQNPNMIYDIFISYSQNDRDWIVEEFMPNVEKSGDISICIHERDFQIGVTILDNIVSCMERSRALMLIISSNFLLSHWCQFEMNVAQHGMFELNKDNLILVFLEDIPRSKRPKNLQYLMDVKTYIKWPGGKAKKDIRPEERKLFWKRLKRSLMVINPNPLESKA